MANTIASGQIGGHGGNEGIFGGGVLGEMFQCIALGDRIGGYYDDH